MGSYHCGARWVQFNENLRRNYCLKWWMVQFWSKRVSTTVLSEKGERQKNQMIHTPMSMLSRRRVPQRKAVEADQSHYTQQYTLGNTTHNSRSRRAFLWFTNCLQPCSTATRVHGATDLPWYRCIKFYSGIVFFFFLRQSIMALAIFLRSAVSVTMSYWLIDYR